MKLSIVTITCRDQPRFPEMLSTLVASFQRRTNPATTIEWIIVDERLPELELGRSSIQVDVPDRYKPLVGAKQDGFWMRLEPPLPSSHRGGDKTPAHNSARNAGLAVATGDYVVFLNDCTVVTRDWVRTAELVAETGQGWRVKSHVVNDLALPADGVLKYRDHYDLLRPVQANAVPGACWGAPRDKLLEVGGFDLAYDGEDKCHDLDAVIRLTRAGVAFVTTEQAFCVRLRRTKTQSEISTRKEAFHGARNQKLLNELLRDSARTLPQRGAHAFGGPDPKAVVEDPAGVVPAVPALSARERRAARAARNQRARKATLPLPRGRRPSRPGHDAPPVKTAPPPIAPPPDDELGIDDLDDASDDGLDELEKTAPLADFPMPSDLVAGGALPDFTTTTIYPPAGLVTPSGPGDPSPFKPDRTPVGSTALREYHGLPDGPLADASDGPTE